MSETLATNQAPTLIEPPPNWKAPSSLPSRFETPRLVLRAFEAGDAESLFHAVSDCRESMLPWMVWVKTEHRHLHETVYIIEKLRRACADPAASDFVIGIFDRATGEVLGGTGLHRLHVASHEGEIGYWVRGDRRGEGICTEATRGMISWGFMPQAQGGWGLRRIHIKCSERNLSSQAVPRKIGLREELRAKQERFVPGMGWVDTLGWGVLADEWDVGAMKMKG
ncbi:MAG: GNAT family N-acetyltransferase [Pyrinomonadaceae bacterium]|nr:GNAT family N-acetyltransferase [Phycisphaerales bacterium]